MDNPQDCGSCMIGVRFPGDTFMIKKKFLFVEADTNDADYISSLTEISQENLEKIMPLIKAIKNFKPYKGKSDSGTKWEHDNNWPHGTYSPREDLGEKCVEEIYQGVVDADTIQLFQEEYVPYGEHGVHTIKSIKVYEVSDVKELL